MIESKMKEKINLRFSFASIRMSAKWYHSVILNSKDLVMTHKDNMCLNFKLVKRCVTQFMTPQRETLKKYTILYPFVLVYKIHLTKINIVDKTR